MLWGQVRSCPDYLCAGAGSSTRQSSGLLTRRLWVRFPPGPPRSRQSSVTSKSLLANAQLRRQPSRFELERLGCLRSPVRSRSHPRLSLAALGALLVGSIPTRPTKEVISLRLEPDCELTLVRFPPGPLLFGREDVELAALFLLNRHIRVDVTAIERCDALGKHHQVVGCQPSPTRGTSFRV